MLIWQAILGLVAGGLILIVSSEKAVDQLIRLSKIIGLSTFTIGFVVASSARTYLKLLTTSSRHTLGTGYLRRGQSGLCDDPDRPHPRVDPVLL